MKSLTDTKTIRERARKDLEDGAVTPDYKLDKNEVVKMLNSALATEIVCVLRYRFHYFMATGIIKKVRQPNLFNIRMKNLAMPIFSPSV